MKFLQIGGGGSKKQTKGGGSGFGENGDDGWKLAGLQPAESLLTVWGVGVRWVAV